MRMIAAVLLAIFWTSGAMAQTPGATIGDAAWLAGRWVGEGLGGEIEEAWAPPAGGQMVGHFQLLRNGAPAIYEIALINVADGALRMRVKHFNPDFTGWENKGEWHSFDHGLPAGEEIRFEDLTLRHPSQNELNITLTIGYTSGPRQETLRLHRAPL